MDEQEIWKAVVYNGVVYSNFEVSTLGRLKNVDTGTIYKLQINKKGYQGTYVSLGSRKEGKYFKIHRAVAETFIDNPDLKPQVNHIDGNKTNNRVENLEWATSQENIDHAVKTGLWSSEIHVSRGTNCSWAKLTNGQVKYIREHYIPKHKEFGCRAMARKFDVCHSTIEDIIHQVTYKNEQ